MPHSHPLPALRVFQLSVNYDRTPALWDVSLEISPGKLVGIIGPNGSGKTTFLKAALNLVKPLSGKIEFFGMPLSKVRGRIAYVPQRETVDWDFPITVRDLVLMGCYGKLGLFRWAGNKERSAAEQCLESVGMASFADRQISQLSGGQQQRVFIARALLQDADVYFLDEPFAGIDGATETVIVSLLRQLIAQGKTIFVVHHDLDAVKEYFDTLIMLNMRLVACGAVDEVFHPGNLNATFGKNYTLLDEAFKLAEQKHKGLKF
jgi:manganese/zinc/iron transport system ATP- binding protein